MRFLPPALLFAASLPGSLAAQDLANGTWRGELVTSDRSSIPVRMDVESRRGKQVMTLKSRGEPDIVMGGVKLKNGWELTFTWAGGGGAFYFCRLTRRDPDGPFDGRCEDNRVIDGRGPVRAALTLFPPLARGVAPIE
jgi:hypothetical protein